MRNKSSTKNPFINLIRQKVWNIEDFIALLNQVTRRHKELIFFENFANQLTECSSIKAMSRLQDPRPILLSFISQYSTFNRRESAFYHQIIEPTFDEMIFNSHHCVEAISSGNFIKRWTIKAVKSRFNLEPHFVDFVKQLQREIGMRAI
jgi:hypothetical protein